MVDKDFVLLCLVAIVPALALLVRGIVWGADSFAYWAVSCGINSPVGSIHSPSGFVWFLQNIIHCNLLVLCFIMFVFYLASLWGILQIGKRLFPHQAILFPIIVGSITPLFFLEAIRFEQQFFGWTIAFFAVGLYILLRTRRFKKIHQFLLLLLLIVGCVFSVAMWFPSILVLALIVFFAPLSIKQQYIILSIGVVSILVLYLGYLFSSLSQGIGLNAVSEEIPLVGLVFILHILHFYKRIPKPFFFYGVLLLLIGCFKAKYMFLATPFLIMGLLEKYLKEGLHIPKLNIHNIPLIPICFFLIIGWFLMLQFSYPTQTDMSEMRLAILYSQAENIPLYNDWGDGWIFTSLGYETKYRASPPNPDWNSLQKPFVAYTQQELDCEKVLKKTFYCN